MTVRTKAELEALFATNGNGEISATDLRDFVDTIMGCYAGLRICEGSDSQDIATSAKITIDQWTNVQVVAGFTADDGDQILTIPKSGIYDVAFFCTYHTTSVYDEVFRVRVIRNGSNTGLEGLCDRNVHFPASLSSPEVVYTSGAHRFVELDEGDEIALEFEAGTLNATRAVAIQHASLTARLIG